MPASDLQRYHRLNRAHQHINWTIDILKSAVLVERSTGGLYWTVFEVEVAAGSAFKSKGEEREAGGEETPPSHSLPQVWYLVRCKVSMPF